MSLAKWAARVCVAVCALNGAASADPTCKLPRLAHADFVTQADGALVLPVSINGQTAYFTLNGNPESFIYAADADRLGFGHQHYEHDNGLFIGGDEVKVRRTADLIIDKVRWRRLEFFSQNVEKPAGQKAIGSLGMNFLASAQLDVEINTNANAINFLQPNACELPPWDPSGTAVPLTPANSETALPVFLDGHRFSGVFDTALPVSSLDLHDYRNVFEREGQPELIREFDSMWVGQASFLHPTVRLFNHDSRDVDDKVRRRVHALAAFSDDPPIVRLSHPQGFLWIGRPELARMRIYFMFAKHAVLITPIPNAPNTILIKPAQDPDPGETEQSR